MVKTLQKFPKISVVMPVFNGEKFLDESVSSILNQTFRDFEFILINDGSTDNTLKIIRKYMKNDKRILLINNKKNKGSWRTINIGLKMAKGKYIAFFCADDISHLKRLEIQFNYLKKHPKIFLVGCSAIYIDEEGKEIRRFRKYDNYKILAWRLRKSCSLVFPSIMLRNEGIFFLDEYFEYHTYYKLLKNGKNLTNLPNFLVKYRVHLNSESVYDKERQKYLREEVLKKFEELEDNTALFEKLTYSIRLFFHYIKTMNEKKIIKENLKKLAIKLKINRD